VEPGRGQVGKLTLRSDLQTPLPVSVKLDLSMRVDHDPEPGWADAVVNNDSQSGGE
jgi:hypothetical protein